MFALVCLQWSQKGYRQSVMIQTEYYQCQPYYLELKNIMMEIHLLNTGQVAGPAGQVSQVVDLMVGRQVGRVDRGVGQEVDKMAEDEVGTEIDQEVGASNSFD